MYKTFDDNPDERARLVHGEEPEKIDPTPPQEADIAKYPAKLINEENRYMKEKFLKLNPPDQASGGISKKAEQKEARFFSSDPVKDKIMCGYWPYLIEGFEKAASGENPDFSSAHHYLTVIIQRYFDLEKGHFDWFGSEITRFERDYLDRNFGVILPRRVARDESWESFIKRIDTNPKVPNHVSVQKLWEHLNKEENKPLSLQSKPDDITQGEDNDTNPIDLIVAENDYKNKKFKKLGEGVQGVFSSDPQKDKIMQAYWLPLKQSIEDARKPENYKGLIETALPYIIVIIQRYYDMQKGHFDIGGSTINKFEREYLAKTHGIQLPGSVAKDETWDTFVGKINGDNTVDNLAILDLRLKLFKPENRPLSDPNRSKPANASMPNGPAHQESKSGPSKDDLTFSRTPGMQGGK